MHPTRARCLPRPLFTGLLLAGFCGCGGGGASPAPPIVIATEPVAPPPEPPATAHAAPPPEPVAEPETPPPAADFTSLAEAVKAGKASVGKVVRLRVRRDHYTSATQFTAVPCVEPRGSGSIWLRYRPEQRDHVRAMYGTPNDACATVSFRVVAFRGGPAPLVEGAIEHVATLAPKRAAQPPAGADYASIDDAILAGPDAKGKIIAGDFWAYDGDPKELWVHDCRRTDAFLFVIPKTKAEEALARQLSNSPSRCRPAHLLMADPGFVASKGGESLARPRADVVSVP